MITPQNLAVQAFTSTFSAVIRKSDAKKQKELVEYLEKLSVKQIADLEERMKAQTTEFDRQRLLFQAMAVERNQLLIKQTDKKFNTSIIVVGVGFILLIVLIMSQKK